MTAEACTSMRYLSSDVTSIAPLQMSPDGTQIAYVLQVPNLQTNENKETLYVSSVNATPSSVPISLLTDQLITASHWFPDNKTLAVMTRRDGRIVLEQIDSATKKESLIWAADGDITDYSMNATGDVIAIAVRDNNHVPSRVQSVGREQRDESKGYRLDQESTDHSDSPRRNIYIVRLIDGHRWTLARQVEFRSPLTQKVIKDVEDNHALHISLSPNGRYLLIDDFESFSEILTPVAWDRSPLVRYMRTSGFKGPVVSYLYDIHTGSATIPLDSPYVSSGLWAPDSKSFIKIAAAPAGSKWEAADFPSGTASNHLTHMFSVDVATGAIGEVLHRAETVPLAWKKDGEVVLRNSSEVLVELKEENGSWRQLSTKRIPFPDSARYSAISSDGNHVVMEYENTAL